MNINLHIERIVINDSGIDPHRLDELKSAIQSELTRQLQTRGLGSTLLKNQKRKAVDGGLISGSSTLGPKSFGQQIGGAIFRGIKK